MADPVAKYIKVGRASYTLDWGGYKATGATGRYFEAEGESNSETQTAINWRTEQVIPHAGTITQLSIRSEDGEATTVLKIHVNSIVVATVTMAGPNDSQDVSVVVAKNDLIAIEFDSGVNPEQATVHVVIE